VQSRSNLCGVASAILIACCGGLVGADDDLGSDAAAFARDVVALARLLGEKHEEPPAAQQVVLLAARGLHAFRKSDPPGDLARRCSMAVTDEELEAILQEACGTEFKLSGSIRAAIGEAVSESVQGGAQLLTRKAGAAQTQLTENCYVGVGISTRHSPQRELLIGAVMPGGPMDRAGVQAETVIRTIDGWATRDQPIEEAVERLRGPEGTAVRLTIRRPVKDEEESLTLYRGVVPQKLLTVEISENAGRRIAILRPREIGGSLAHEIREVAAREENLAGVLLDLRGVSGRAHFAALVADQFLNGGEIGTLRSGNRLRRLKAEPGEVFSEVPLAIATDAATRGSAAWMATLLKERNRATVFGRNGDRPNLEYEAFDLPSGDVAAFATMTLMTPEGAKTLVVSEQTHPPLPLPSVADLVKKFSVAAAKERNDVGRVETTELQERRFQREQAATKEHLRMSRRDSFVIAKEYLENLPVKKG